MFKSVGAGALIGLAGYVYLSCENKYVGAFLFSVGLLSVLVFGCDLFTGKVCFPKNYHHPLRLLTCFLGNVIGCIWMGIVTMRVNGVGDRAKIVMSIKYEKSMFSLVMDGMICGMFIAIAVVGYRMLNVASVAKSLIVVMAVMGFILCGSEHVIADCYYVMAAMTGNILGDLRVIVCVLIGNVLGGLLSMYFTRLPINAK